jgi:cytochrome c2
MKKTVLKPIFFLVAGIISVSMNLSCYSELVPSPAIEEIQSSTEGTSKFLAAPTDVSCTQGAKRKITISWTAVSKAVRYFIYSAQTPFDTFTQVAETVDNSYEYTTTAGTTLYFKITAVDYSGSESSFSSVACGSSLAQPIISDIVGTEETEDTSVTVYWYMENVSASTYLSSVCYTITCIDSSGNTIATGKVTGANTSATQYLFANLTPNSTYCYTVDAYLSTADSDVEKSETVDAATARRLRPNAPSAVTATQGSDKSAITLSFTLPDEVDVAVSNSVYEQHPLYFKIYRRLPVSSGETENEWTLLVSHLYYDGTTTGPSNTDAATVAAYFEKYKPGDTVTWKNNVGTASTDIQRGVKYEYKVQSYADNSSRLITSNLSAVQTSGWAMAVPMFKSNSLSLVKSDDASSYISATLTFAFTWNNLGAESNYTYVLHEVKYKLEKDNGNVEDTIGTKNDLKFATIAEVNLYTRKFTALTNSNTDRGYYVYSLDILDANSTSVITLSDVGKKLVSDSVSIPVIDDFSVANGYVDSFILSWTYDATCTYTVKYVPVNDDGTYGTEVTVSDLGISSETANGSFTYKDAANSGDRRIYTLVAYNGVTVEKTADEAYTLGTPSVLFDESNPSYDSIAVTWSDVQQAESYTVSLLDSKGTAIGNSVTIDATNVAATTGASETNKIIKYVISQPQGYNDARISGTDFVLSVVATSAASASLGTNTSKKSVTVRTLGPAKTSLTATKAASEKTITVTWNAITGAAGYILCRDRYAIDNTTSVSTDCYFIPSAPTGATGEIKANNNDTDIARVSATTNGGVITLSDNYVALPSGTSSAWQDNQDKLAWGLPYHYTVYPVKNSSDSLDTTTKKLANVVTYTNVTSDTGSCLGYGQNVTATKSEYANSIVVTWTAPYLPSGSTAQPVLWYAEDGWTDESEWTKADVTLDSSGKKFTFVPATLHLDRTAPYDFAVKYTTNTVKPHKTYLSALASTATSESNAEAINKGYAFAISCTADNVPEDGAVSYSERIGWTLWDFTKRAVGPAADATYTISMKNANYASGWQTIATVKQDGTITLNNPAGYAVTMTKSSNSITLTPTGMSDTAIHTGLLRVLRDYKQYVKMDVVSAADTSLYASYDDDDSLYTYRKISNAEFAKSAMLAFTYPFYLASGGDAALTKLSDVDISDVSTKTSTVSDGLSGSFYLSTGSLASIKETSYWGKYKHSFYHNAYAPYLLTQSGEYTRFMKITTPTSYLWRTGLNESFYVFVGTISTSVSPYDVTDTTSQLYKAYSGTLSITCTGKTAVTVSVSRGDGTTASFSGTDTASVRSIFPMRFYKDDSFWIKDSTYGWW